MSELNDQILAVQLCECGQPQTHKGMCRVRLQKAADTRARNKQQKAKDRKATEAMPAKRHLLPKPSIDFYHLHCEGEFIKVQLTGKSVDDLKISIITLGNSLGFNVEVTEL